VFWTVTLFKYRSATEDNDLFATTIEVMEAKDKAPGHITTRLVRSRNYGLCFKQA
jgi:hypothetical protein